MHPDPPPGDASADDLPPGPSPRKAIVGRAEEALAQAEAGQPPAPQARRLVAAAVEELSGDGELARAAELAERAGRLLGGSSLYTAGKALCHAGLLPGAEAALRLYLREAQPEGQGRAPAPGDDDPEASPLRARHLLGRVAMLDGQLRLAERWLRDALALSDRSDRVPIACDLVRVWLRARRLDRAVTALLELCQAEGRELLLLSAEVAMMLGDVDGAIPLCRAALDPTGRDDRAAALLGTLLLRGAPDTVPEAVRLLPLLPGRRFDTLAVRLCLLRLGGQAAVPEAQGAATRSASDTLLSSLPPLVRQLHPSIP